MIGEAVIERQKARICRQFVLAPRCRNNFGKLANRIVIGDVIQLSFKSLGKQPFDLWKSRPAADSRT